MKKISKINKMLSLLLVICFVLAIPTNASASIRNMTDASLNAVVQKIKAENENAEVTIENGQIHVYVEENNDGIALLAAERVIRAPKGGVWTNFVQPWYTYLDSSAILPYSMVYLPHAEADALYISKTTTGLRDFILNKIASNLSYNKIIAKVLSKFNVTLTKAQIIFIASSVFVELYKELDKKMLANVLLKEKGVRVDYTTIGGWPVNYYYVWDSVNVTNSPWEDFNPKFHAGVYSASDI